MNKNLLTVEEVAKELSWSVPTVRRWMWHLGVKPASVRTKRFMTSKGLRATRVNVYDGKCVEALRRGHDAG